VGLCRICPETKESFTVEEEDLLFYDRISPRFAGERFSIPPPLHAPQARFRRRRALRNELFLFRRLCDRTGRSIVSIFSPESPYKVYDQDGWWSDRWDAREYGRDFDFSRPFMEQYRDLTLAVPHMSLYTRNTENSYYTNYTVNLKNSYLCFGTVDAEDCLYSRSVYYSRDIVDSFYLVRCELCYEGIASDGCYRCFFFLNCRDCSDCSMIEDCHSCSHCVLCFGLQRKEYCILNEPVGKERYQQFVQSLFPLTRARISELRRQLADLKAPLPHRQSNVHACEDCSGDALYNSKNCRFCFDTTDCEDCRYLCNVARGNNCYDGTYAAPYGPEFCYHFCSSTGSTHSMGIFLCWLCHAAYYSMECQSCKHIMGCIGLRNKEYCIFNKQYSQAEYERLAGKIAAHMQRTGEWGEYFPPALSFFPYNHTVAHESYPLAAAEARRLGFEWAADQQPAAGALQAPPAAAIDQVGDDILGCRLRCERTGRPYKINAQELKFYRRNGLPLPSLCPDARSLDRSARRTPRWLWPRRCAKTGKEMWSSYAPDRPEIVYSEEAWLDEHY